MGDVALGVHRDRAQGLQVFYDYDAKYAPGRLASTSFRRRLNQIFTKSVQKLSLEAHRALGCRGVSRTDFRFDDRAGEEADSSASKSTRSPA